MRQRTGLIVLLATAMLLSACASAPQKPTVAPISGPSPFTQAAKGQSVPSLSLVDASTLPKSVALDTEDSNAHLKPGSYTPFLTGDHIVAVNWGVSASTGQPSGAVVVFDATGKDILVRWTRAHPRGRVVILLGNRVIGSPVIVEPLTTGVLEISGRNLSTPLEKVLGPAIVTK